MRDTVRQVPFGRRHEGGEAVCFARRPSSLRPLHTHRVAAPPSFAQLAVPELWIGLQRDVQGVLSPKDSPVAYVHGTMKEHELDFSVAER